MILRHDQGMTRPRLLRPLVITLVALFCAACGGGAAAPSPVAPVDPPAATLVPPTQAAAEPTATPTQPPPTATVMPTVAPTDTPAPAAAAEPGDPKSAILAAARKQATLAWRTDTTITTGGKVFTVTGEFAPPLSLHVLANIGGQSTEMIMIDDKGWMKIGPLWTAAPASVAAMIRDNYGPGSADIESRITDVKYLGPELLDGSPTWVYTFKSTQANVSGDVKAWIEVARGLVVQQQIEGEAGGVKSVTLQKISYDPSITIEPPK